ncbi:ZZ-type zinc finger-containing protein P35G2.11c [Metarhizium anisopliae]|nr:ZZ-type zinc finger-containing protein P35G2.11c [Metarhizium anisopliae]
MSSVSHAGPDAMVTIKVTFEGVTRRAKMPLREMVPRVLEEHIRIFLQIPTDTKIMIERYSDSAAAFVMLDASNMPVYKQLYRAAKAKSKLKLRVSVLPQSDASSPKPVTIEDASESAQTTPIEKPELACANPTPLDAASSARTTLTKQYDSNLLQEAAKIIQDHQAEFHNHIRQVMKSTDELASLTSQMASCQPFTTTSNAPEPSEPLSPVCPATGAMFAVCCNSCEQSIPVAHYHCSTCDDGDFDLCQSCVDQGITCYSDDHWLIKRIMNNGQIVNSTTETIAPKLKLVANAAPKDDAAKVDDSEKEIFLPGLFEKQTLPPAEYFCTRLAKPVTQRAIARFAAVGNMRTCNQCVRELPEREFLHCTDCEDYDLCQPCFAKDAHGHHPKHAFTAAVPGTEMPTHIRVKMNSGRNQVHHAICDGCDAYITGVRHKCLDCPDWDYCAECAENAHFVHPNHRFAAIYEPLADLHTSFLSQPVHMGICCDGPLCSASNAITSYIRGIRYKCAVCHDLDFCANCEASPANDHNKTHPLIKFKTPVRHVSVTTTGEHQDGKRMPAMGDRSSTISKATETVGSSAANAVNAVQTVVDVKPTEADIPPPVPSEKPLAKSELDSVAAPPAPTTEVKDEELRAVFLRDTVADGTIFPPNHVFEQTWILRNEGATSWPAGCCVKYVGGDYMGHVDSSHPAGISELVSASESTICYAPLAPGQEYSFTALLRTPIHSGKMISYWRLTTPDGMRFGHRLWCEVNVRAVAAPEAKPQAQSSPTSVKNEPVGEPSQSSSVMIFPKLEKESPSASVHEDAETESPLASAEDGFGQCDEDDEWDASEDGFLTDEEYDILDASDEEFLEEQEKKLLKK